MTLRQAEYEAVASSLAEARQTVKSCAPATRRHPELTLRDAYAISRLQFDRHLARTGERQAGWKIGLTSAAHRERYGVDEPTFGYLTEAMRVESLSMNKVLAPQVEGELVIVLARDLEPRELTVDQLADAVDYVCLGIEVTDRRIAPPPYDVRDLVADNSFACGYVLGKERHAVRSFDLVKMRVTATKNGIEVSTGTGDSLMGSPLHSATWLANRLTRAGERLRAGQLILSGSFGPSVPVSAGDQVRFSSPGVGAVELSCLP